MNSVREIKKKGKGTAGSEISEEKVARERDMQHEG